MGYIFRKLGMFRTILERLPQLIENPEYYLVLDTMESVGKLYSAVARSDLAPDWEVAISIFSDAWTTMVDSLDITTPPKVHVILEHIPEYIYLTGNSLNHTSDQHVEAAHAQVAKISKNSGYDRKITSSFSGWQAMQRKIDHVNSLNLKNFNKKKSRAEKRRAVADGGMDF